MELLTMFRGSSAPNGIDMQRKVVSLPISHIKANPYQPRRTFESIPLEELSQSIRSYGVMQPITVRKLGNSFYELVAGERRLRASKMAGLTSIPAIVVEIDNDSSAILALLENLQRENLNYIEEAEGYARLIHMHQFTQEELASKLGKKQSTVANKLRLLRLPHDVREALLANGLTERHARALLKLETGQDMLEVLEAVVTRSLNVKETEALVTQRLSHDEMPKKKRRVGKLKDIRIFTNTIRQAVEMMVESGIKAKSSSRDCGDHLEYTIIIPK